MSEWCVLYNQDDGNCLYILQNKVLKQWNIFPRMNKAKSKEEIFISSQIIKLILNERLEEKLRDIELAAWQSLRLMCVHFSGQRKKTIIKPLLTDWLESYKNMRLKCLWKFIFFTSILIFPQNLGDISDEYSEQFH